MLPAFYVVVIVLGILSMGFQLLASRLLNPHFGSSIIVWAWLISTFLAAFSIGSMVVQKFGCTGDFIGHIAGDDFVFVTSADRVDDVCRGICERFDHLIRLYYFPADRAAGYIETKDRFGVQRRFPIMSVSIAAISLARAKTYAGLAELAATGKRTAKAILGSTYVRDGETVLAAVG